MHRCMPSLQRLQNLQVLILIILHQNILTQQKTIYDGTLDADGNATLKPAFQV